MPEALLRVSLEKVQLDDFGSGCTSWNGLIQCSVHPGGSYVGMVPFANLQLQPGQLTLITPKIIVYDGVCGICDDLPDPNLVIEVSVSGVAEPPEPISGAGFFGDVNNPGPAVHSNV